MTPEPPDLGPLALAALHLRAMYTLDERGGLVASNPPNPTHPPVLHLVRTTEGNRWALRSGLDPALRASLEGLLAAEPVAADLPAQPAHSGALREAIARAGPDPGAGVSGPAFVIPRPDVVPPDVIRVTEANRALLDAHLDDMYEDLPSGPLVVSLEGGEAIAHCHCARRSPVAAVEAGVRTLPGFEGRGHATRCALAWAAATREEGRLPLYSTSWENLASRAVARHLAARLYGVDFHLP